jgi:hypothetical protein
VIDNENHGFQSVYSTRADIPAHLSVEHFTTAALLVLQRIEARDEKRLLPYQKNLARQELLIVDERAN